MSITIYVACLAAYNNGKLHGKWIDACQDYQGIHAEISKMLKESPEPGAKEWALHDYEGFLGIKFSKSPNLRRVSAVARLLETEGDPFAIWYETQNGSYFDAEELEEKFLKQWQGMHDSEADFAEYLLDSTNALKELPGWAKGYFNFDAYARDLSLSGEYSLFHRKSTVCTTCPLEDCSRAYSKHDRWNKLGEECRAPQAIFLRVRRPHRHDRQRFPEHVFLKSGSYPLNA